MSSRLILRARLFFPRPIRIAAIACVLALVAGRSSRANYAFNYSEISQPILSATFSVNLAAFTANQYIGGIQVNRIQLFDGANVLGADLSNAFFGTTDALSSPPSINQGTLGTGIISAAIPSSFFSALSGGHVGLSATFTDTKDGLFAIDTIFLAITTASGTTNAYYPNPPNGFGIGLAIGANLPGPLPGSLGTTGTGFDEAISSKSILAIGVPEPKSVVLTSVGLLLILGSWRVKNRTEGQRQRGKGDIAISGG